MRTTPAGPPAGTDAGRRRSRTSPHRSCGAPPLSKATDRRPTPRRRSWPPRPRRSRAWTSRSVSRKAPQLIRAGHLDPDAEKVVEYLDRATRIDAERRGQPDAGGHSARALFTADGQRDIAKLIAEAEKNPPESIKDIFADCETDEVRPRDEVAEAAENEELERSLTERLAAAAEEGDTTLQDFLEDALATDEEDEDPPANRTDADAAH